MLFRFLKRSSGCEAKRVLQDTLWSEMRQTSDVPFSFAVQEIAKLYSLLCQNFEYDPSEALAVDEYDGISVLGQFELRGA
jgi:hypothetical protein